MCQSNQSFPLKHFPPFLFILNYTVLLLSAVFGSVQSCSVQLSSLIEVSPFPQFWSAALPVLLWLQFSIEARFPIYLIFCLQNFCYAEGEHLGCDVFSTMYCANMSQTPVRPDCFSIFTFDSKLLRLPEMVSLQYSCLQQWLNIHFR